MRAVRRLHAGKRALQEAYARSVFGGHAEVSTAAVRAVVEPAGDVSERQRLPSAGPGLDQFLRMQDAQQAQQPDTSRAAQPYQASSATNCLLRGADAQRA